jgi:EmrB/QacA subfamily drug resistance transporter
VTWRAIFFLNLPVAVGAVAVTLFATHESRDETSRHTIDWPGIAALSIGLTALVLALIEGNAWGWGSAGIVALLATAAVGLVTFVIVERRVAEPMVDFTLFRSRTFLGTNAIAFIVSFAMLAMFFFTALYMQNILGYSAIEAGIRFLPSTLMIVLIAPLAGRLTDRIGPRPLLVAGLSLVTVALYLQTRIDLHTGYGLLLPAFVLMGIGMALTMSPMSTAAMNAVAAHKAGVASGILSMSRMVGGTFGVAALGALFQHLATSDLADSLAGTGITAAQQQQLVSSLGTASDGAHLPPVAAEAAHNAFIHALASGMWLSAGVAALGVLLAYRLIGDKPVHRHEAATQPEAAATEAIEAVEAA